MAPQKKSHPFLTLLVVGGCVFGVGTCIRRQSDADQKHAESERAERVETARLQHQQMLETARSAPHAYRFRFSVEFGESADNDGDGGTPGDICVSLVEFYTDGFGEIKEMPKELRAPSMGKKDDYRYEKLWSYADVEGPDKMRVKDFRQQYYVTNEALKTARMELDKMHRLASLSDADQAYARALEEALAQGFVTQFRDKEKGYLHYMPIEVPLTQVVEPL